MITGLNHITLAVADLDRSLAFYRDLLGGRLRARWDRGAYLELGPVWLCLSVGAVDRRTDYSHIALSCAPADFEALAARLAAAATIWQDDTSEGASVYVADPDGHQLEVHLGDLASRLAHYRADPGGPVEVFD